MIDITYLFLVHQNIVLAKLWPLISEKRRELQFFLLEEKTTKWGHFNESKIMENSIYTIKIINIITRKKSTKNIFAHHILFCGKTKKDV